MIGVKQRREIVRAAALRAQESPTMSADDQVCVHDLMVAYGQAELHVAELLSALADRARMLELAELNYMDAARLAADYRSKALELAADNKKLRGDE